MIVLQGNSLSKSYGAKTIFDNISLTITDQDKAGLVGPNGIGKSTLLKCLIGEEEVEQGVISKAKDIRIGYLSQFADVLEEDKPLLDFVMDEFSDLMGLRFEIHELQKQIASPEVYNDPQRLDKVMSSYSSLMERYEREGGYSFESRAKGILIGLGFVEADLNRNLQTFSGGQKTRISLAKLLSRTPNLLILDEPTNYLDLTSLEWLEGHLASYPGAILLVSHDRYFLDQVTNKTFEMKQTGLEVYPGGYSKYLLLKAEREDAYKKAYRKQQDYLQKQQEYILKYKAGIKARQARGRQSALDRLKRLEKPSDFTKRVGLEFEVDSGTGEKVLEVKDLYFSYSNRELFRNLEFNLFKNEKVALIGKNGTGKTTLLKILLGELSAKGSILFGSRVKPAYFSQEHENLNLENTLLEELWLYPDMTLNQVRSALGRFLFFDEDAERKVETLSGGERSRLMLAKLFIQRANLLIMDEPTNHLDVATREVLEAALEQFQGNLLFVSHDRYFINRLATRVVELEQGRLTSYLGNFDYYKWKKNELRLDKEHKAAQNKLKIAQTSKKPSKKANKPLSREKAELAKIELEIENFEQRFAELTKVLADPDLYNKPQEAITHAKEYKQIEDKLECLYEAWEQLISQEG